MPLGNGTFTTDLGLGRSVPLSHNFAAKRGLPVRHSPRLRNLGSVEALDTPSERHWLQLMIDWIVAHATPLNLAANWVMVAIWIAYLQVFLWSFRRHTIPKIVINRAAGSSLHAACFVSNMSSEAIYIESVIVNITSGEITFACAVTDFEPHDSDAANVDPKHRTFQGILAPSQYTSLGTFDYLIGMVTRRSGYDVEDVRASDNAIFVEVTIIADHASERLLTGAKRRFSARWCWSESDLSPFTDQGDHATFREIDVVQRFSWLTQ
jgi:hypothetical protein